MSSWQSVEHVAEDPLEESLGEVHVVGQFVERDFGLDHPELGQVPRGVAVLGAEGGAEGVDLAEGRGEDFAFQLAADGEVRGRCEEVERVVDFAFVVSRQLFRSSVVTRNISPAPSQSLAVMIGVWM